MESSKNIMGKPMGRRSFLASVALVGAGAALATTGCAPSGGSASSDKALGAERDLAQDWLGEPPVIEESQVSETVDVDVLVVGAGCAGYFAAAFASEGGANTLLIEKSPQGCGIRDSALGAVDSRMQLEHDIRINKAAIVNDMAHFSNNVSDMRLHRLWADHSGEAIDWYCDLVNSIGGITVDLEWDMPSEPTLYSTWPVAHGTNDGGELVGGIQTSAVGKVADALNQRIKQNGGEVRMETSLVCLIKDGDRVAGAYAVKTDGSYLRINAKKGVVVATGGYVNNDQMYSALQPQYKRLSSGWCCHATMPATGDGIKACLWAGAHMEDVRTSMIFDRGLIRPDEPVEGPDGGGYYFNLGSQPFLKVNMYGERYCNESAPYDYCMHGVMRNPEASWYPVWDSTWEEDVLRFHTTGCSTMDLHEGGDQQSMGMDAARQEMEDLVEQGLLVKADTIEELAEKLGFENPQVFVNTVERYNQLCVSGEDTDFGKESFRLSAIDTPPYYSGKMGGVALCTLDGIDINTDFQALDTQGNPIEGLYVLGNDSGGYYAGSYPNLVVGMNAGRNVTHGMLCGKALAEK